MTITPEQESAARKRCHAWCEKAIADSDNPNEKPNPAYIDMYWSCFLKGDEPTTRAEY